jgi:hypothetical protein
VANTPGVDGPQRLHDATLIYADFAPDPLAGTAFAEPAFASAPGTASNRPYSDRVFGGAQPREPA